MGPKLQSETKASLNPGRSDLRDPHTASLSQTPGYMPIPPLLLGRLYVLVKRRKNLRGSLETLNVMVILKKMDCLLVRGISVSVSLLFLSGFVSKGLS